MENMTPKIIKATISPLPKTLLDPMPVVTAVFDDDTEKRLFDYFPDEISFTPEEFVGLTEAEACQLKFDKDLAYLKS